MFNSNFFHHNLADPQSNSFFLHFKIHSLTELFPLSRKAKVSCYDEKARPSSNSRPTPFVSRSNVKAACVSSCQGHRISERDENISIYASNSMLRIIAGA